MKQVVLAVVVAVLASVVTFKVLGPDVGAVQVKESAAERVVRTGVLRCSYGASPPNLSVDPNTKALSGPTKDIVERMAKELELKVEWVEEVGWGNIAVGLDNGRYDAFCSNLWPDGPRRKNMELVTPFFYSPVYAFARVDDTRFDGNLARINQKDVRISAVDGDVTYNAAKADYPNAQVVGLPQTATSADFFENVTTGKADVGIVDKGTFEAYSASNPGKLKFVENVSATKVYPEQIGVGAGEVRLKLMLDGALQQLIDNGVIEAILAAHKHPHMPAAKSYQAGAE